MNPFILEPREIQSKIDQDQFSGVIYIVFQGQPIVSIAAGFADREHQIPNRIDTKFNLGSMSKMFTAIAIAQLAQEGLLQFDDSLGKYLKDYPNPDVREVTIHQLLTHTGGTGDVFGEDFNIHLEKLKNPIDFIHLYGHRKLEFLPGSRFAYSNYGFILLGAVIEKVSKQNYYDYIHQNIYQIASMNSSDSYWKTDSIPDMAIGYMRKDHSYFQPNQSHLPMRGMPTGGSYSTVEDLLRFAIALQTHRLLNPDFLTLLTTGKVNTPDGQKYAYGFRDRIEKNELHWFGHSGGGPGANTTFRIYPQFQSVMIVLSNLDYPAADRLADFVSRQI